MLRTLLVLLLRSVSASRCFLLGCFHRLPAARGTAGDVPVCSSLSAVEFLPRPRTLPCPRLGRFSTWSATHVPSGHAPFFLRPLWSRSCTLLLLSASGFFFGTLPPFRCPSLLYLIQWPRPHCPFAFFVRPLVFFCPIGLVGRSLPVPTFRVLDLCDRFGLLFFCFLPVPSRGLFGCGSDRSLLFSLFLRSGFRPPPFSILPPSPLFL